MSSLLTVLHKILILHYSRAARGYEDLFCLPKLIHVQSRVCKCIVILGQLGHPCILVPSSPVFPANAASTVVVNAV